MNAPWRRPAKPKSESQSSTVSLDETEDKKRRNREAAQRYREVNREKILAKQRERRAADPAKARLQREQAMKRWKERNPDRAIAKHVLRYEAVAEKEREAARQRSRERRARDPEAAREADRQYRAQNLDRMRAQARARYARKKAASASHENDRAPAEMPSLPTPGAPLGLVPSAPAVAGSLDGAVLLTDLPGALAGAPHG